MSGPGDVAEAVRRGLSAPRKSLPPFLFYDERGSLLFEEITRLPEYYLTRTERGIFERDGARIAEEVAGGVRGPVAVLELGAGSATKTELLLRAFSASRDDIRYFPADVSPTPLEEARKRLAASLPELAVEPIVGPHAEALRRATSWEGTVVVLFIGSSIGNYDDHEAVALLSGMRESMGTSGRLLLGVDRAKSLDVLLPAYDDRAGVTAAFNLNVLTRINQELGGDFDLDTFRHVAVWNEASSAIEMHLESLVAQRVCLTGLGLDVAFARGERIHTESSHKYTSRRVETLFEASGLSSFATFEDPRGWFALHVARAR